MYRLTVYLNGVLLRTRADLCATLYLKTKKAHSVPISGTTSSTSVQANNTEFPTMSLNVSFLALSVLQALKSSLTLTGSSQRTSTVNSMQTATSLKNSSTSEKISLFRITSTDLQIRLNSTSKYQDIFQRISLQLVQSHS